MKIETAKVVDFAIESDPKFHVRAMLEIRPAGDPRRRLIWVELNNQETGMVERLANQVKARFLADPPNTLIEQDLNLQ
ncbi:MAG: hypothetical protein HS126_19110 [Anaerolineales bacterium]|nr:hypothetical protein [Anaerolineales bacterium]